MKGSASPLILARIHLTQSRERRVGTKFLAASEPLMGCKLIFGESCFWMMFATDFRVPLLTSDCAICQEEFPVAVHGAGRGTDTKRFWFDFCLVQRITIISNPPAKLAACFLNFGAMKVLAYSVMNEARLSIPQRCAS